MLALFLWLRPPRQKAWRSGYSLKSQLQKQSGATATIPRRFSNIIIIVISKELFENEKSLIYTTCHFEGAFLATEKSLLYRKHQVSLRSLPMVWKYHTKQKCHFEGAFLATEKSLFCQEISNSIEISPHARDDKLEILR